MKVTFKTEKPTGKYKSFSLPSHFIKIGDARIGSIDAEDFTIRLMIIKSDIMEDGNKNCPWKWVRLSRKSVSLQDAKEFIKNNFKSIEEKFNLFIKSDFETTHP